MVRVDVYEVETGMRTRVRVPSIPPVGGQLAWGEDGRERQGTVTDVVVFGVPDDESDEEPRPPTITVRDARVVRW